MSYKETCLNPESIRNEICHRYDSFLCILLWKSFPNTKVNFETIKYQFSFGKRIDTSKLFDDTIDVQRVSIYKRKMCNVTIFILIFD